jgi:hypothetical protein
MAFSLRCRRLVEAVLAVVATAAMFYFGDGLEPWWPLMWFAPLPLLWFALRSKWWTAAVTAVAVMMLGNLNIWSYFTKTLGMPGAAWVNIFLAAGVVFAAAVLLFRVLVLQRRGAERGSCFAGGLGDERICAECNVATWVGRKSCVFAAEVSPVSAAGFDHGALGDDLCVTAVSCCDCDCAAHQTALMEARVAGCWRGSWRGGGRAAVWCAAAVAAAEADK